jgi:hypothetical protein
LGVANNKRCRIGTDAETVFLYEKSQPYTILPKQTTMDLALTFDKSVRLNTGTIIDMGYAVYNGSPSNMDLHVLDLTYTSLRNVLYDLSEKYRDKKIYIHQLSCRTGDYVPDNNTADSEEINADVNELARKFETQIIGEDNSRIVYTEAIERCLWLKNYAFKGRILETDLPT